MSEVSPSKDCLDSLLELRIGRSLTASKKRFALDLDNVAALCRKARNAAARAWLLWRLERPEWTEPAFAPRRVLEDGSPSLNDDGTGFDTWLYHRAREAAPTLAAIVVSSLVREVLANLKTSCPVEFRRKTGHRYRWQAILACDEQLPAWRFQDTIPVPNGSSALVCLGEATAGLPKLPKATRELAAAMGATQYVLACPFFSEASSRQWRHAVVLLEGRQLSPGNRNLLRGVPAGDLAFRDSEIVFKRGQWFFQLALRRPAQSLGLDKERVAHLWPAPADGPSPFVLETLGEGGRRWDVGDGVWLYSEYRRLEARRLALRNRYRTPTSGVKGHGRGRFEARLLPWARSTQDRQAQFVWNAWREVVKFCRRHDCGAVVYHQPLIPIRDRTWLSTRGVPFDETGFVGRGLHRLRSLGIELTIEGSTIYDLRNRFGPNWGTRGPQNQQAQTVTNGDRPHSRYNGVHAIDPLAEGQASDLPPTT